MRAPGRSELLSENTTDGYYTYTHGRTDQDDHPVIEQIQTDTATATATAYVSTTRSPGKH